MKSESDCKRVTDAISAKLEISFEDLGCNMQRSSSLPHDGLCVGSRVLLYDLRTAELNGQFGRIVSLEHERAGISLEISGKLVAIRYGNLLCVAGAPPPLCDEGRQGLKGGLGNLGICIIVGIRV